MSKINFIQKRKRKCKQIMEKMVSPLQLQNYIVLYHYRDPVWTFPGKFLPKFSTEYAIYNGNMILYWNLTNLACDVIYIVHIYFLFYLLVDVGRWISVIVNHINIRYAELFFFLLFQVIIFFSIITWLQRFFFIENSIF